MGYLNRQGKGKAIPVQAWTGPEGSKRLRHMKVVRLLALSTGRLNPPPGNIPSTHFCYRLSRPQGHSAAGRINSMKNSSDSIRNQTSSDSTNCDNAGPQIARVLRQYFVDFGLSARNFNFRHSKIKLYGNHLIKTDLFIKMNYELLRCKKGVGNPESSALSPELPECKKQLTHLQNPSD